MLRTIDRKAAARPRSGATTTSVSSASAGATGSVRNRPPTKNKGKVTARLLLAKAGTNKMVAMIDDTTAT